MTTYADAIERDDLAAVQRAPELMSVAIDGNMPIDLAVAHGARKVFRWLLDNKAASGSTGECPLDLRVGGHPAPQPWHAFHAAAYNNDAGRGGLLRYFGTNYCSGPPVVYIDALELAVRCHSIEFCEAVQSSMRHHDFTKFMKTATETEANLVHKYWRPPVPYTRSFSTTRILVKQ